MLVIVVLLALLILAEGALMLAYDSAPRSLEQRFADLAVKVRSGRGTVDGSEADSAGTARMLLFWAARHMPASNVESPRGEKLSHKLAQAGFTGPNTPRMVHAIRLATTVCTAVLGMAIGLVVQRQGS